MTLVRWLGILGGMSTLLQIESEVAALPQQDQRSLLAWLQGRLSSAPASTPEALKAFRQLQEEVRLSPEGAVAWKSEVGKARR